MLAPGKHLVVLGLLATLLIERACAQNLSTVDAKFVKAAAVGQQFEVSLGKVAITNGSSDFVKGFGQMMVNDHSAALKDLLGLGQKKNMPPLSLTFNSKQKATFSKLSKLKGAAFDRAYRAAMAEDHTEDLAEFKKEASGAKDSDVRAFAKKCVPVIQKHLAAIKSGKMPKH